MNKNNKRFNIEFTLEQMGLLLKQGDAEFLNRDDDSVIVMYGNLYNKEGERYYHSQQRIKYESSKEKSK